MEHGKRASWSGQLAFVLAAAASAIGLGNLWRFPYLAAQYGGGTFIVIYLALVVTLGFTLMLTEIAIGRKTQQSQLTAYSRLHRGWGFIGVLGTVIPMLIVPYYCVIGGWVVYYFKAYCQMAFTGVDPMGAAAADSGAFFSSFISAPFAPFGYATVFIVACAAVIVLGVKNGIEKSNLVMMPLLLLMAIAISVYVVAMPGAGEGLKYYLVPNLDCLTDANGRFSFALLGKTLLGATGQMFYSLSLAMGIMITYGSYMRRQDSVPKAAVRIVAADTFVAVLSGFMIIPVVVMFAAKSGAGRAVIDAGPGLMFVSLPKVFANFGATGAWIGLAFFTLVLFAAFTSAISMTEACVAAVCDYLHVKRNTSVAAVCAWSVAVGSLSAFGYGRWKEFKPFGLPALDFFDSSMNVLTPVVAALICVFAGWVLRPKRILAECHRDGSAVGFKTFYAVMVKFIAPLLVLAILVSETCRALKVWDI